MDYKIHETLTSRESLKKFVNQRVRFTGVVDSVRYLGHHRVIVCITNVNISNELTLDHVWLNFQEEWFSKRLDDIKFKQTKLTGTALVSSYTRKPKQSRNGNELLSTIAMSVDYGLFKSQKMEFIN